ncbi:unnamed protein product, partial [Mesorhabditis spiculigera]
MSSDANLAPDVAEYVKSAIKVSKEWRLPDGRGDWRDAKATIVKKAAVIGGGTMGRGIAIACVLAGFETILVEQNEEALSACCKQLETTYTREMSLGRMSEQQRQRLNSPAFRKTTSFDGLAEVDLVIEAIFESMKLKKELMARLDAICKPDCIIASNTSSLDFDEMSSPLKNPGRLVGMHFFNPANVIKVIEIVYGSHTSKEAVATAFASTAAMGKLPILVANCPSFMFNRLLHVYLTQAMKLTYLYGMYPKDIDRILAQFGLQMGPMTMHDMNGIDVGARIKSEHGMELSSIERELIDRGRLGRKTGKGFYRYDSRGLKSDDPEVKAIIDRISAGQNTQQRHFAESDVISFLLYPMVNEGYLCLEDGIIASPQLIDLMFHFGFGWPRRHGGPMRWAERYEGLQKIGETMRAAHSAEPEELVYRLSDRLSSPLNSSKL